MILLTNNNEYTHSLLFMKVINLASFMLKKKQNKQKTKKTQLPFRPIYDYQNFFFFLNWQDMHEEINGRINARAHTPAHTYIMRRYVHKCVYSSIHIYACLRVYLCICEYIHIRRLHGTMTSRFAS